MMEAQPTVYDARRLELGEGPLWHHERGQLFWFDIIGQTLLSRDASGERQWQFDEPVSAAGIVDRNRILIASASGLQLFDIETGKGEAYRSLEADRPDTRSNDGRADPQGGFWIGTMSLKKERKAGAIWRLYRGEVRKLFPGITIPNAICFSPDGDWAFFADTPEQAIMRVRLGPDGWPKGEPEVFIDLSGEKLNPDGAVIDAEGRLWNAQWGASRIACYSRSGKLEQTVPFAASRISCPAFGGPQLSTLYATSAQEDMSESERASEPQAGRVFAVEIGVRGQTEHRVIL